MNIPARYQVFDKPVLIDSKDEERLSPYLSGWMRLVRHMSDGLNEPDLQRLIVLELTGKQRREILRRLMMRFNSVQKKRLKARIEQCLGKKGRK